MLIELKDETNEIDPHRQESLVNDSNDLKKFYIPSDQYDTEPTIIDSNRTRDIIKDIINDIIGPPVGQPTPKVKYRPSSK